MINKFFVYILFSFFIISCGSSKEITARPRTTTQTTTSNNTPTLADKVIWTAVSYKGTPYRYGGTTKRGIDCSALVQNSFSSRGVYLPRSAYDMSKKGIKIPLRKAQRGDLLFFKTNRRRPGRISHVGLVTSVKNGVVYFIHASTKRGVTINNMSENYYKRTYAFAKKVLK